MISLRKVKKQFHQLTVIDQIELEVERGDLVALIGPSGCGKSTLLRCINGLETLDAGEVQVLDTVLKSPHQLGFKEFQRRAQAVRAHVGMVFQSFNLFPHLTILQNLMITPRVVHHMATASARTLALEHLKKVGLEDKADHFPLELSGGQQQRAAIARALVMSPVLMLYDEPTSALDPGLVNEVLRVMKQLDEEGMTQIVVTHEMRFAREVADRIAYIEGGRIIECGPPSQIFSNPKDPRTREFLKDFL